MATTSPNDPTWDLEFGIWELIVACSVAGPQRPPRRREQSRFLMDDPESHSFHRKTVIVASHHGAVVPSRQREEASELLRRFERFRVAADVEAPTAAPAVQSEHRHMIFGPRLCSHDLRQPTCRLHLLERRHADGDDDSVRGQQPSDGGERDR